MIRLTSTPPIADIVTPLDKQKPPIEVILSLLADRFPEAPQPEYNWSHGYYVRCNTYSDDGNLIAVYFPASIVYVLDVGYENLVVFSDPIQPNITADPTFPHWEKGQFYCARREDAVEILYPFLPRDLFIGTEKKMTKDEISAKLSPLNVTIESAISDNSFLAKSPAYQEDSFASRIRAMSDIKYVERNSTVRIIDLTPGWLIDRIF